MNVPFTLADGALDADVLLAAAAERQLSGLKGHKSVEACGPRSTTP
jgi:phosphoserine aminotransferase